MAENRATVFVVEIPNQVAMEHHPLTEISKSPGHLLLLKLLQREDDLFARKIAIKETRIHSIKREISHLCTSFLLFHGIFFTLLFTASVTGNRAADWWVPSSLSLATSLAIVAMAQLRLRRYWKVRRQLENERVENRAVGRRAQELRMKGAGFDLSSDPIAPTKRFKSSSVEISWGPSAWCKRV
ncbi:hypothetical protein V2J09_020469 [Rumex salicifolius]